MRDDPELLEYPGRTAAFARLMRRGTQPQAVVKDQAPLVDDLMKITDEELVLLGQVRLVVNVAIWQPAFDAEISRRTSNALKVNREATEETTAALVAFKRQAAISSDSLATLTKWLIVFTAAVVLLTVVLVTRDLSR